MKDNSKNNFRNLCLKRLKFESCFSKVYKDKKVIKKLYIFIKKYKPKTLLLYIPMKMEVNVQPLINRLRREKQCEVYVPYIIQDDFKIVKYRLPLKKRNLGIKQPNISNFNIKKIDLAIVPIIGVDGLFKRIGFGKGMYDKFFHKLKYKPCIVFTQLKLCRTTKILSNSYDIQANYIITT